MHASYADSGRYCYRTAIIGFVNRLSSIAERNGLEYGIVVAWDNGVPDFRRDLYQGYKTNRASHSTISLAESGDSRESDEFSENYSMMVKVLSEDIMPNCKCMSLRVHGTEADDIIAYICYKTPNLEKRIISSDRDYLQLIDENTCVYSFNSARDVKLFDYDWMSMNYSINSFSQHFLIEKSILGDTSDNIPGIAKVGEKTAKKYADMIIKSIEGGMSLEDSLKELERPPRATKIGFENLKLSIGIITRNMHLMDLEYPLKCKPDYIYGISKSINMYSNIEIDYYRSMDLLERSTDFYFNKCFSKLDKIFESNCNYDPKLIIERC